MLFLEDILKATGMTQPLLTLVDVIYTLWRMPKQNRSCDLIINTTTMSTHPSSSMLWLSTDTSKVSQYILQFYYNTYSESQPSGISSGNSVVDNCKLLTKGEDNDTHGDYEILYQLFFKGLIFHE